ncbi:hypothetical protein GN958_ATG12630 [Phytophthora infestans]|uniref:Uncharacterized protein n=1 Tax=Phytophthora infestans TaxID=4787 RepID=A0A8S9UAR3_PHYIN|nr:hypothetical protein GN958_ATG12630 [Phytophthora infestans]
MIDNFWDIGSGGDQVGKFTKLWPRRRTWTLSRSSDGKVKWWGNGGGGFTHTGPCELYIDDKMVLHGDDCEEEFPGGPNGSNKMSEMPVDFSSCNGKCTLTIYWLGFLKRAVASVRQLRSSTRKWLSDANSGVDTWVSSRSEDPRGALYVD